MSEPVVWIGVSSMICDICRDDLESLGEFVDGKTLYGPWAKMCLGCHESKGCGLGTGRGQHFKKQGEQFVKISG